MMMIGEMGFRDARGKKGSFVYFLHTQRDLRLSLLSLPLSPTTATAAASRWPVHARPSFCSASGSEQRERRSPDDRRRRS